MKKAARLILAIGCIALPMSACTDNSSHDVAGTRTISDSLFGVVLAYSFENCLRTSGDVHPGMPIQIILIDRNTAIPAVVGEEDPGCGDGATAQAQRTFELDAPDLVAGDFGIAVLDADAKIDNNRTDLDGDGVIESYRICTSAEGFHATAWAGEWFEHRRIWHDYYYLGHDMIPTCSEPEMAGSS